MYCIETFWMVRNCRPRISKMMSFFTGNMQGSRLFCRHKRIPFWCQDIILNNWKSTVLVSRESKPDIYLDIYNADLAGRPLIIAEFCYPVHLFALNLRSSGAFSFKNTSKSLGALKNYMQRFEAVIPSKLPSVPNLFWKRYWNYLVVFMSQFDWAVFTILFSSS